MRNHSSQTSAPQEFWSRSQQVLDVARRFIRLRYKLLPYLYNLTMLNELTGDPMLRPLMYEFPDTPRLQLSGIQDQFMVGPSIMQAPIVSAETKHRQIVLPKGRWWSMQNKRWLDGGRIIREENSSMSTPLFFREGTIVPMQRGVRSDNRNNLRDIELLVNLPQAKSSVAHGTYSFDDGETLDYRKGKRSEYAIMARSSNGVLTVTIDTVSDRGGAVRFIPCTLSPFKKAWLIVNKKREQLDKVYVKNALMDNALTLYGRR